MFTLFNNRPNKNSTSYIMSHYELYDKFITDRAAGAVNGTSAEPIGGARTVVDTNSKISIGSGVLNFATGEAANDGVRWPVNTRVAGRALISTITPSEASNGIPNVGWDTDTSGAITDAIRFAASGDLAIRVQSGGNISAGAYTALSYETAVIMRAAGMFYFIKGGAFANWTLVYISAVGSSSGYPTISSVGAYGVFTADNIRVPKRLFIPVPLQSDGFSASTTDGAGNAEANAPVGTVWVDRVGTVGRSGTTAIATALSGGIAICTLPAGSAHVLHQANVTRGTTGVGIILRYVDVDNYVYIKRVASNVVCIKRIAGSETTLINAAATEVAASPILGIFDVSTLRAFYNNAAVGAAVTIADAGIANSGEMGLIFFDTDSVVDNLQIFARGNEGQYSGLDSL